MKALIQLLNSRERETEQVLISGVIVYVFIFLWTENVLNSDLKAEVLEHNLPLKYGPLLY